MFNNYSFNSSLRHLSLYSEKLLEKKPKTNGFVLMVLMLLFAVTGIQSQTQRIPAGDGNFTNGSTFAANGWTVANQGVSPVKWAVGTAASGTSQTGNVTSGSTAVTLTAPNAGITVGQIVYGSGIPANTFVSAISGTALTLSQTATISTTGATLGFGKFSGGISVGIAQLTTASIASGSYTITLAANPNPNISVGMAIAPSSIIGANTFVASINGTTLGLSQATIGSAASAQTLNFTATSAAIAGNAAYVSNDNGATNSYAGYATTRTVYFYRDITTVPANETAMTLTFDVKSAPASGGGWQVFVAPTSQTVTGTDTQVTLPFTYPTGTNPIWAGATLISFNSNPQVATTKTTAFIPKSFAGTSFRLIFVWTNGTSPGTLPPAAIDNISLTSRTPEEITCAQSGLWSQPGTWDGGKVPTPADTAVLDSNAEVVMVDSRYSGCENLTLAGTNTLLQFAISTVVDEFTVGSDISIAASGARFNNHDGTNGKYLKVGGNFDVGANARFDSQLGSSGFTGRLNLNGSALQTVTVDLAGFVGGSAAGVNTTSNVANVLSNLEVTNTSTASPNVIWDANGIRIKSGLVLTSGRVSIAAGKRLILGNFSQLGAAGLSIPPGYGFTSGTVSKWMSGANTDNVQAGTEYPGTSVSSRPNLYPFISGANLNRNMYILLNSNPTTAGEIAVTYTDATTSTGSLSVADGSYTINNRYDGNWSVTTPNSSVTASPLTYTTTTNHRVMVYATGAYEAIDGSSRLMNVNSALAGTHQEGTEQPFVVRTDLSLANMIAAPLYIGASDGSKISSNNTITSTVTGGDRNWNTAATWVGGVVPACTNNVIIASGATVNVSATADAASVVINAGGTLTNNGGTMTVGCTNNNNAFINYGTHTMTSGTLNVNGFVAHKVNSTFNQTGGNIIIDSNDNGTVATSVAFGGSSCKIDTSNLALTGGKITIVDPLVNEAAPVVITSASSVDLVTPSTGTFTWTTSGATTTNSPTIVMANPNYFYVGQTVSGTGIAPGTTVTAVTPGTIGFTPPTTLTLSSNTTAAITAGTALTFSAMQNGATSVVLAPNANNAFISNGSAISGPGIQPGTTITSFVTFGFDATAVNIKLNLSLPVSGLTTSPATSAVTLSMPSFTIGSPNVILPAANPSLINGMPVSGTGLLPGTFIAAVEGAKITFSSPIQPGAPTPLVFNVYPDSAISSGSFVYSGSNYAAGLNHTLQIGDGVSTQKGALLTNGFNCVFWTSNGMFSLGNLTIDAPDGDNRFMSTNNFGKNTLLGTMNVQNQLTITAGSTLKKLNGNNTYYVGGNIVNNGSFLQPTASSPLYLGNFINQVAVPTSLAQTISGTGIWSNNQYSLTTNSPTGAVSSLTINNTNPAGVTLQVPNFRSVLGVTLTNGILYTSAAYPIYCGVADVTGPFFGGQFNGGSATSYIDGPCFHANKSDANINQFRLFPTGKNGKYLPISISSTGGVELMAEAFDTNSGTVNTANASGLSANRWKLSRVGTAGTFTGYNVRIGSNPEVTASNIIVHATADQGTYDIVNTPASAMTFVAGTPNTLNLTTPQTGGFLGNFAFVSGPGCSGTPAPGATVASTTTPCAGQSVTLSLTSPTTGAGVTYQWRSSVDGGTTWVSIAGATADTYVATPTVNTSYACTVTCSSSIGVSNPVAITMSASTATTTGNTVCEAGSAVLGAAGSTTLNWYDAATGGNLVATGTSYSPTVAATTTYYVASASVTAGSAGVTSFTGTAASTALFSGIAFDVTNKVKLKTVTVYPKNTSALTPITVALFDATGNVVAGTAPVTFTPTLVSGTIGTVSQNVTLNYNIPIGTGYRLVATFGLAATTNTLGNSTSAITYPTTGAIRLTGNVTNLSSAVTTTANTTSCFHNLTFDEVCESVTRTPVIATVGCTKNLKLFIEGYYDGASTMRPVKNNQDYTSPTTDVDDVTVELRNATAPYAVAATTTAVLKTDGSVAAKFNAFPAGNYFIAVKHRNAVQTWSAAAEPFGVSTSTYDFSTAANKAYGDNMVDLGGVFGFYSGDINQDEGMDNLDGDPLFDDVNNSNFGVLATDLNGDGGVDNLDADIILLNINNSIFSNHP